ncbi:histidine phosphatase family protein [Anaerorhabdus sp.]|jgi:2,3-bisphosphoglycerate-dependent phosphoglycerate mutase|uniref:histidine phosphatase family protein n=1 Tax=Anaerorhabdus sp. TaxID=1872524 RepID=UPI002FC730D9
MKTIYLFRHTTPQENSKYHNESIPISKQGVIEMKNLLSDLYDDFDSILCSPYVRAVQTAQIISSNYSVDDRLCERRLGMEEELVDDFWARQYSDYDYKNIGGESLNDVRKRMVDAIDFYLNRVDDNQTIAIVSHATAICSFLLSNCSIAVTNAKCKERKIIFNERIIIDGKIKTPSCFKLVFDNEKLIDISYIE